MPELLLQILYQTAGGLGMAAAVISFQCRNNKPYYLLQATSGAFFALQFFLSSLLPGGGAWAGFMINALNVLRGVVYAFCEKARTAWPFSIGLMLAYTACGVLSITVFGESVVLGILVTVAQLAGTVFMKLGKPKVIRIGTLTAVSPIWLVYDIFKVSVGGILCESFNMGSIVVALFRFRRKKEDPPADPGDTASPE